MTGIGICHFMFDCFADFDSAGFLIFMVGFAVAVMCFVWIGDLWEWVERRLNK